MAKIADFGLSRTNAKSENVMKQGEKTANVGTPLFMAPELMSSDDDTEYNAQIDVYSFGVVMWSIISREVPYLREVKKLHLNLWSLRDFVMGGGRPYIDGHEQMEDASTMGAMAAVRLMEQCWDKDPDRRPPSFEDIASRLGKVLATMNKVQTIGERGNGMYKVSGGEAKKENAIHTLGLNPMFSEKSPGEEREASL